MPDGFHHPRTALAITLADRLTGRSAFGAEPTVCLAGPRRTGKSTFLRHDLIPELKARDLETVYVDLWSDKATDPALLVASGVRDGLRALDNPAVRIAKSVGLKKVAGVEFDLERIGQPNGPTLADALEALHAKSGRKLVVVVDEAQHALGSPTGESAMFALKAARDRLNTAGKPGDPPSLALVLTGSHRDKLVRLAHGKKAPFFGTSVTAFPPLDRTFTDALTDWLNTRLAEDCRFAKDAVWEAFGMLGHQPERLLAQMREAALGGVPANPSAALLAGAAAEQAGYRDEAAGLYAGLSPLQQAVLRRLAKSPEAGPFSQAAMADYAAALGKDVAAASVQSAIDALRDRGLVWQSARGEYAVDDQVMVEWLGTLG